MVWIYIVCLCVFSQAGEGSVNSSLSEEAERLAQMDQLVSQLKEMIREKDAALRNKDEQLKVIRSRWLQSECSVNMIWDQYSAAVAD